MHSDLVDIGWTDDHWNRIVSAVTEEAQKARVAAQILPMVGPVDPAAVAVPAYQLLTGQNPRMVPPPTPFRRLAVDSDPSLYLTQIAINVPVRTREAADPELNAALSMFRRAANYIARVEDALVFNGRAGPNALPPFGVAGFGPAVQSTGDGVVPGIFPYGVPLGGRIPINISAIVPPPGGALGDQIVTAIIQAINALDATGQLGPYACVLSPYLFEAICTPNANLVLPRDRILPFLQGPLLRSSTVFQGPPPPLFPVPLLAWGAVIATSANPVELIVATDLNVRYLQTTEEPRLIFRVCERVAVRIKETSAIAILHL